MEVMIGIVIQGPTNLCKQISNHYSFLDKVIWSTWNNEPLENIKYITSKKIDVILSPKPTTPGPQNLNFQLVSSLAGVKLAKEKGWTHVIKVRSDVLWEGIEQIFDKLINKKIAFLNLNTNISKRKIKYFLDYWHEGYDFTSDHVIFGKTNILEQVFTSNEDYSQEIPPESVILRNYLKSQNHSTDFSPENLKKAGVYLFGDDAFNLNNRILWLKNNPVWDLVRLSQNPHEYYITKL
jgi:hypothetical protein